MYPLTSVGAMVIPNRSPLVLKLEPYMLLYNPAVRIRGMCYHIVHYAGPHTVLYRVFNIKETQIKMDNTTKVYNSQPLSINRFEAEIASLR